MKRSKILAVAMFCLTFVITISIHSCKKDSTTPTGLDATSLSNAEADNALATNTSDYVDNEVTSAMVYTENNLLKSAQTDTCPTITVVSSPNYPKDITVDYGTGCNLNANRVRSGVIHIHATGPYRTQGSVLTVTFTNFYINGNLIEGTKTVTNNGLNSNNHISFSVVLVGGKLTKPDGSWIAHEFTRTREWIAGSNTPRIKADDVYSITGGATGSNSAGLTFTRTITKPITVALNCDWNEAGTVQTVYTKNGSSKTVVLDFGDGTCDNVATVSVDGGAPKTIIIK